MWLTAPSGWPTISPPWSPGGKWLFHPQAGQRPIKLPVGEYRVDSWIIARKDEAGAKWEMRGMVRRVVLVASPLPGTKRRAFPLASPSTRRPGQQERLGLLLRSESGGPPGRAGGADSQRVTSRRRRSCTSGAETELTTGASTPSMAEAASARSGGRSLKMSANP